MTETLHYSTYQATRTRGQLGAASESDTRADVTRRQRASTLAAAACRCRDVTEQLITVQQTQVSINDKIHMSMRTRDVVLLLPLSAVEQETPHGR